MKKRVTLKIHGLVQGVFYRYSAKEKASQVGVTGTVRNLPDGTVEAIVEGEEDKINQFIAWTKKGPDSAEVERVDLKWNDFKNEFNDFSIIF